MQGETCAIVVTDSLNDGQAKAAPLAGALLYIGQTGDVALGGLALLALGLGMGLPPNPGAAAGTDNPLRPLAFLNAGPSMNPAIEVTGVASSAEPEVMDGLEELQAQIDQANAAGQAVVVDFYADWCVSCKIMERRVFADPEVRQAMSEVVRIKPDVMANSAADREIMQALEVLGPTTLIFIGPNGEERRGQRIVSEVNASTYLQRLREAF